MSALWTPEVHLDLQALDPQGKTLHYRLLTTILALGNFPPEVWSAETAGYARGYDACCRVHSPERCR